jgi:NAD-dependent dihydropyrimidine dehydrogenase PreA subunit
MEPRLSTDPHCKQPPGTFVPLIDRNRCEGKGPCVDACPYDVLAMGVLSREDKAGLSLIGKLKAYAHGNQQVFLIAPDLCRACGACVRVCPEHALSLTRRSLPEES